MSSHCPQRLGGGRGTGSFQLFARTTLTLASPPNGLPQRAVRHPTPRPGACLASHEALDPSGGPCHLSSSLLCTASFSQDCPWPVFSLWLQWQSRVMGMGPRAGHCWPEELDPLPDATPH